MINKNMDNEYVITIKANGSSLGMQIDPTDTFEVSLYEKCTDELVATIDMEDSDNGVVTIYQESNGKINILLKQKLVDSLVKTKGDRVDGCYPKSGYRLLVKCSTVNNGNFVARIDNVYVV